MASLHKQVAIANADIGVVNFKIGSLEKQVNDKKLKTAISSFIKAKKEWDLQNIALKTIKDEIIVKAKELLEDEKETTITFSCNENSVKVVFAWDINITNQNLLFEVLGTRFDDLVNTKISYIPTAKLKEMSLGDEALAECLSLKEKAPAVSVIKSI